MIMRRMMMMMMNLVSLGFPLYLSAFSLGTQFSQNTLMVHTKHIVLDTYQSHYHFLSHVKWNSTQSLKKVQNSDSQALDAEKKERRGWRQLGEIKLHTKAQICRWLQAVTRHTVCSSKLEQNSSKSVNKKCHQKVVRGGLTECSSNLKYQGIWEMGKGHVERKCIFWMSHAIPAL